MSLAEIEARNARILALTRDGRSQAEIAAALAEDYPGLARNTVGYVVARARQDGRLPALKPDERRALSVLGGQRGAAAKHGDTSERNARVLALMAAGAPTYPVVVGLLKPEFPSLTVTIVGELVRAARKAGTLPDVPDGRHAPAGEVVELDALIERRDAVIALVRARHSYTSIAARLAERWPGMTRSTVSGIVNRARANGLLGAGPGTPFGGRGAVPRERPPRERTPRERTAREPSARAERPKPERRKPAPKPVLAAPVPELQPLHLADDAPSRARRNEAFLQMANSGGCKWPEGDPREAAFHYCCAQRRDAKAPYCADHMAVAFVPAGTVNTYGIAAE